MRGSGYWDGFWRRRLGRRRLLTGAAVAGGGLAAAALVGCGGKGTEGAATLEAQEPADGRQAFVPAPAGADGGVLRYANADPVVLGRFDPHQSELGPVFSLQAAVFSKLYLYRSHEEPTWDNILPDLAESAPEMIGDPPDTYVIRLRRGVKFHDNGRVRKTFPSLAGRELTADDVIFSLERQRNRNSPQRPFFYRSSQYDTIDRIDRIDDYTVRIATNGPLAPFYHFLADTTAFILPREIIDQATDTLDATSGPPPQERMIGTGPFMWDELTWGTAFKAVRNPSWFGWGEPALGRPYVDSYVVSGSFDDATSEPLFRAKKLDMGGWLSNPEWVFNLKRDMPELVLHRVQLTPWVNSRLKTHCPPFNDVRVRKALHLATDREQIIDVLWKGEARPVGPVGTGIKYWALPQEELEGLPGYRRVPPERERDIAEARAAYEAAGSPEIPPIWAADIPFYIPEFMPTYAETLRRNLGTSVRTVIQSYARVSEAYQRDCNQAPMTWVFDNGWIDLDDWVYPYFHSRGSRNSFGASDAELDGMLEAQRREFDADRRRQLGYDIQRYLLGAEGDKPACYARLDYAAFITSGVAWPYLKNRVTFPMVFGNSNWNANVWFDRNDPSFQGRS